MLPVSLLLLIGVQAFYTGNDAGKVPQRISDKSVERDHLTFLGSSGHLDDEIQTNPSIENRIATSEFNKGAEDLHKIRQLLDAAGPSCQLEKRSERCPREAEKTLWRCAMLNMQISKLTDNIEERSKTLETATQQVLQVLNFICTDPSMDDLCLSILGPHLRFSNLNSILNENIEESLVNNSVVQEEHAVYYNRGKNYLNVAYYNPLAYEKACQDFKKANELTPNQRHNTIYLQFCELIGPSLKDLRRFTDTVNLIRPISNQGNPDNDYADPDFEESIHDLFISIDNLTKIDSNENLISAYDLMNLFTADEVTLHYDFRFCWRFAKVIFKFAHKFHKKGTSDYILLSQKAMDYSNRALRHNPNDPNVNLWAAASLEAVLEFDPKIQSWVQGFRIKEYLDKAKVLVNDPDFYHFYGKWHFEASKRYFSTLNEACNNFKKAQELKPDWSENEAYVEECRKFSML